MLGPFADNGGPTLTHTLLPGSPAIDAGNNGLFHRTSMTPMATVIRRNRFRSISVARIGGRRIRLRRLGHR